MLEETSKELMAKNNYEGDFMNMIDKNFKLTELEILGEGTFGKVVKCFDEKAWRSYAMKI